LEKPHRRLGKATATLGEVRLRGTLAEGSVALAVDEGGADPSRVSARVWSWCSGTNPGPGSRPGVRRARSAARDASLMSL